VLPESNIVNRVGVLIPFRNSDKYFKECLDSLAGETLISEIILVDNGSGDKGTEIARAASLKDSRIKILSEPKEGISHALNRGLLESSCDFVARIDADDELIPGRITEQMDFLIKNPEYVVVCSNVMLIDSFGKPIRSTGNEEFKTLKLKDFGFRNPIPHPSVMYRLESVRNIGLYNISALGAEDLDLWFKLIKLGKIGKLGKVLTKYRIHDDQISRNHSLGELTVRINMRRELKMNRERYVEFREFRIRNDLRIFWILVSRLRGIRPFTNLVESFFGQYK